MAVRRILQIENPDDKKILQTRCHPLKLPSQGLRQLINDLFETMHDVHGVGLAAPQVGVPYRVAVIYIPAEVEELPDGKKIEVAPEQHYALINPQIVKTGGGEMIGQEGCLSLPGWYAEVPRHAWVTVEYTGIDGKQHRIRKATGLLSRALQHEIDHLDGILFTERIRDISTLKDYSKEAEQPAPEAA